MAIPDKSQLVQSLSRMIESIEERSMPDDAPLIPTGWAPVDQALGGGLSVNALHEFYGPLPGGGSGQSDSVGACPTVKFKAGGTRLLTESKAAASRRAGTALHKPPHSTKTAPLCLLVHLARQAAGVIQGEILWIGRRCWPNPQFLTQTELLERSLFVDAPAAGLRLWAIELALRCSAVAAIVGDAEGFNISATRRLQLAARQGRALVMLARPGHEAAVASAAATRWSIYRRLSDSSHPAWTLELLRCKGRQLSQGPYGLEWDCGQNSVIVSAALVDQRPSAASAPVLRRASVG